MVGERVRGFRSFPFSFFTQSRTLENEGDLETTLFNLPTSLLLALNGCHGIHYLTRFPCIK